MLTDKDLQEANARRWNIEHQELTTLRAQLAQAEAERDAALQQVEDLLVRGKRDFEGEYAGDAAGEGGSD